MVYEYNFKIYDEVKDKVRNYTDIDNTYWKTMDSIKPPAVPDYETVEIDYNKTIFNMSEFSKAKPLYNQIEQDQEWAMTQNLQFYLFLNNIGLILSGHMSFYALSKILFNVFAEIKVSIDKWSQCDIYCSIINIIAFMMLRSMTIDDLKITSE